MNYFLEFIQTEKYLPYVVSSYLIGLTLILILKIFSIKKTREIEKKFLEIENSDEK